MDIRVVRDVRGIRSVRDLMRIRDFIHFRDTWVVRAVRAVWDVIEISYLTDPLL